MNRLSKIGYTVALALALLLSAPSVPAQRALAQRGISRSLPAGPQLGGQGARPQRGGQAARARRQRMQQQLMQAIGVTQEQRMRMAEIRRNYEDELAAAGRRLRMARRALDQAIMSEQFDEELIRRRAEELAAAQGDVIRLQTRVRAQVRSVLTSEQVARFHELERRLRRQTREQRRLQQDRMQEQNFNSPPAPPRDEESDLLSLLLSIPPSTP